MQVTIELPEDIGLQLTREGGTFRALPSKPLFWRRTALKKLTAEELSRLLGFESRYDLDGFLKQHEIWLEYSLQDFEREAKASARIWQQRRAEMGHDRSKEQSPK